MHERLQQHALLSRVCHNIYLETYSMLGTNAGGTTAGDSVFRRHEVEPLGRSMGVRMFRQASDKGQLKVSLSKRIKQKLRQPAKAGSERVHH